MIKKERIIKILIRIQTTQTNKMWQSLIPLKTLFVKKSE